MTRPLRSRRWSGSKGAAFEPELAVVVVFDHHRVPLLRPFQERRTALQRHRRPERELVRGRHVDQLRRLWDRRHNEPVVVDGNADHACPETSKESADRGVSRVLHRHAGPCLNQHAPDQIERLLRALRDDYIIGVRPYGA
jgi:hypothetical protein